MKWIPVISKRTMFIYFILLFLLYLFYALNSCLVDEKKFTLKYVFLKHHISKYRSVGVRFAALLGFNFDDSYQYRRLKQNQVPVKRLPDALIIGVKKCGTRALLEFLRLHPDVRAAGSEVHFFDKFYHKGFEWYRDKMPPTLEGQITMEKTPSYWVTRSAPKRVYAMNPSVKLLAVVRDPVTRAISDYTQSASKRPSLPRFEDLALVNNSAGWGTLSVVDASWPPVRLGVYARPLRRWLRRFPRSRLLLINGERLVVDPAAEMSRVQAVPDIGSIEHPTIPTIGRQNTAGFYQEGRRPPYPHTTRRKDRKSVRDFGVASYSDHQTPIYLPPSRYKEFLGLKRVITEKHFYFNSTKGFPCLLKSESRSTPHCLGKTKGRSHPYIDPRTIERLRDFYRPFNERFYQLAGINFGWP